MPELPPLPGEITMEELMDLARRLSAHPENRPGTDKTWVLERMRRFQRVIRAPKIFMGIGDEGEAACRRALQAEQAEHALWADPLAPAPVTPMFHRRPRVPQTDERR